jgi:hypothetical protein
MAQLKIDPNKDPEYHFKGQNELFLRCWIRFKTPGYGLLTVKSPQEKTADTQEFRNKASRTVTRLVVVEGLYDAKDVAVERFEVGLHFSQAPKLQNNTN